MTSTQGDVTKPWSSPENPLTGLVKITMEPDLNQFGTRGGCGNCSSVIGTDPEQGGLLVHVMTRSRRCAWGTGYARHLTAEESEEFDL